MPPLNKLIIGSDGGKHDVAVPVSPMWYFTHSGQQVPEDCFASCISWSYCSKTFYAHKITSEFSSQREHRRGKYSCTVLGQGFARDLSCFKVSFSSTKILPKLQ